jgi:hypothetical protein
MKVTFQRLKKIALETPPGQPMQPFYDENRAPTPLECILWFLTYAENIVQGKPDAIRCIVCGEDFENVLIMGMHYQIHKPKGANKKLKGGEAKP